MASEIDAGSAQKLGRLWPFTALLHGRTRVFWADLTPCSPQGGQLEVLRLLLERGAAVDAADPETGYTAFHLACMMTRVDCIEPGLRRAGGEGCI